MAPDAQLAKAPYSGAAVFVAAFLGGPVGVLGMFGWNAVRLGRLRRDAVYLAGGTLLYAFWMLSSDGAARVIASAFGELLGRNGLALTLRLLAMAIFGVSMWRHRKEQRSTDLFALRRPSPWLPAIAWIVVGTAADALIGARA